MQYVQTTDDEHKPARMVGAISLGVIAIIAELGLFVLAIRQDMGKETAVVANNAQAIVASTTSIITVHAILKSDIRLEDALKLVEQANTSKQYHANITVSIYDGSALCLNLSYTGDSAAGFIKDDTILLNKTNAIDNIIIS